MDSQPPTTLLDLPTELLNEISWKSDNQDLPMVCRHLRDVIHGTPSFWTVIYLGDKQNTPNAASFLIERLERSSTRPLNVFIQATEPSNALALELWFILSTHRDRICTLDIDTETPKQCGTILYIILLTPPHPSTLPLLQTLDIRYDEEDPDDHISNQRNAMDPKVLLHPMPSFFPALTTLVLPLLNSCMLNINSPIPSLKTLVLDGSTSWSCNYPNLIEIAQFLAQLPQLEIFWCKVHRIDTYTEFDDSDDLIADLIDDLGSSIKIPILLPRLTKMAVVVPGLGIELLQIIEAPALHDLHMDGTRDDDYYRDEQEWLGNQPEELHAGLQITSSRSPTLRRLSLVGAYLPRDTWLWLFGCGEFQSVPFPLLESIALCEMKAVKGEVTNTLHDALAELSAGQHEASIALRRFAYIASEPPLLGVALDNLVNAVGLKQAAPDYIFEIELDGVSSVDFREQLDSLPSTGVRVCLHEEPVQCNNWWYLRKDIDPTEADSY